MIVWGMENPWFKKSLLWLVPLRKIWLSDNDVPGDVGGRDGSQNIPLIPDPCELSAINGANVLGRCMGQGGSRNRPFTDLSNTEAALHGETTGLSGYNGCKRVTHSDGWDMDNTVSYSPDLGTQVPMKIKHKIWANEFVDLTTLIVQPAKKNVGLTLDPDEEGLMSYTDSGKKITTFGQWTRAFRIFSCVS